MAIFLPVWSMVWQALTPPPRGSACLPRHPRTLQDPPGSVKSWPGLDEEHHEAGPQGHACRGVRRVPGGADGAGQDAGHAGAQRPPAGVRGVGEGPLGGLGVWGGQCYIPPLARFSGPLFRWQDTGGLGSELGSLRGCPAPLSASTAVWRQASDWSPCGGSLNTFLESMKTLRRMVEAKAPRRVPTDIDLVSPFSCLVGGETIPARWPHIW